MGYNNWHLRGSTNAQVASFACARHTFVYGRDLLMKLSYLRHLFKNISFEILTSFFFGCSCFYVFKAPCSRWCFLNINISSYNTSLPPDGMMLNLSEECCLQPDPFRSKCYNKGREIITILTETYCLLVFGGTDIIADDWELLRWCGH